MDKGILGHRDLLVDMYVKYERINTTQGFLDIKRAIGGCRIPLQVVHPSKLLNVYICKTGHARGETVTWGF